MKRSTTEIVLESIRDMHAREQIVTREGVAQVTGLKLTTVDDRLAWLVDEGEIHRVQRGVFVPAMKHPPARLITQTVLPCGTVKLEIGDDHVITLTPRESRMLGQVMSGHAREFTEIEAGHHAAVLASELKRRVLRLERESIVAAET